jgi:hypothetical protein
MTGLSPDPIALSALAKLAKVASAKNSFACAARFSPGAWWGFNGVASLGVDESSLYIFRNRFARRPRLEEVIPRSGIRQVSSKVVKRWNRPTLLAVIEFTDHPAKH